MDNDAMDNEKTTMDVMLLGVKIGTASGWDEAGDFSLQFYDFSPLIKGLAFVDCLTVDPWHSGLFEGYDPDGNKIFSVSILEVMKNG